MQKTFIYYILATKKTLSMNVLLKEEKWLLLKGSKSKYDWAKTNKGKSKSAEGVRGQSTDYGRMMAKT
jgi:hypothetical protein